MQKTSLNNQKEKQPAYCTNCFKSLGVPTCMDIYTYLRKHGKSKVADITNQVHLTQPTVSYHLKEMRENGLLSSKKLGKEVYYEINPTCPVYENECVLHNVNFLKKE